MSEETTTVKRLTVSLDLSGNDSDIGDIIARVTELGKVTTVTYDEYEAATSKYNDSLY